MARNRDTDSPDDGAENIVITDDAAAERYATVVNGELAYLEYRRQPGAIVLVHTEVPPELEGHGIGSALARRALNDAAEGGLAVVPECQFVASYIREHPQYLPLVPPEHRGLVANS